MVFAVKKCEGDSSVIDFIPLESFVGQLDVNAKNATGGSDYIGDIVNSQSKLIRFFSNVANTGALRSA